MGAASVSRLLTGITELDLVLGGGLAMGQVVEVFGTAGVTVIHEGGLNGPAARERLTGRTAF